MRKLATVRTITELKPIAGADKIETALIDGWEVVVGKDQFKAGEKCVYFEIDSFFQANHPLLQGKIDNLLKNGLKTFIGDTDAERNKIIDTPNGEIKGARLKTISLRGQISQGFVMKLSDFDFFDDQSIVDYSVDGAKDLSEVLGILKYDSSFKLNTKGSTSTGSFPFFIPKTDAERIQNIDMKNFLANGFVTTPLDITVKYDGSSMTVYATDDMQLISSNAIIHKNFINMNKIVHVGICSRNNEVAWNENPASNNVFDENVFTRQGRKYAELLKQYHQAEHSLPKNIALQGELISPNIQNNFESVNKDEFHIFNIYDIDQKSYVSTDIKEQIIQKLTELSNDVPVMAVKQAESEFIKPNENKSILDYIGVSVDDFNLAREANDMEKLNVWLANVRQFFLSQADGDGYKNPYREGIVMKPVTGNGLIFKAISNHYLLKHEK